MINTAYKEDALSDLQVFRWHKAFLEGREGVDDEDRAGQPSTTTTANNVTRYCGDLLKDLLTSQAARLIVADRAGFSRYDALRREQYLFNVFEAIISTLESKLQRIENLDKAVEHLMRRVEGLDTRVNNNIDKTESVIAKLRNIDSKLFQTPNRLPFDGAKKGDSFAEQDSVNLNKRLVVLDQKVSDIDDKLSILKKPTGHVNVMEITKALNTEVINHVTKELGQLKEATGGVDKKLQFHINLVQENLGKVLNMMTDVHHAIIDEPGVYASYNHLNRTTTTTTTHRPELPRTSKIDSLVQQMKPIISVSEKMDEVWDVVVGTKSSVDDLVPKSDELLTQTQRQERAIGEIHSDLRTKTNKIIANLDKVEKRLKKQEDDVATLAQRPVPADLLMDPTIDNLSDYESTRVYDLAAYRSHADFRSEQYIAQFNDGEEGGEEERGIIFPSVKNKPTPLNSTFVTSSDVAASIKDVKIRPATKWFCVSVTMVLDRSSSYIMFIRARMTSDSMVRQKTDIL
ncbi:hypothetical protein NQ318_009279 [Aromia moschata]|uniref:t-SNARE coiled-coil homology domain-containing protein n=1 Tax=Aromia moschata TaxID=1265417 RepID=A0AAV8YK30_9CUCU|nr:hypothetical protein NQ318_009279 [Aromia moschata]